MIALYPGAFKPPHRGHFNVVKSLLDGSYNGSLYNIDNFAEKGTQALKGGSKSKPKINKVIIFVGGGERNGITKAEAEQIWQVYSKYLGNVEIVDGQKNPMFAAKDYAKENTNDEFVAITGIRSEDDFVDLKRITTFKNTPNVQGLALASAPGSGVRATDFRKSILSGNLDKIIDFFPEDLSQEEILNILTDLKSKIVAEAINTPLEGLFESFLESTKENLQEVKKEPLIDEKSIEDFDYSPYMASLIEYMLDKKLNILPLPEIKLRKDSAEANNFFGRTAYYNPNDKEIVLYTLNRHPKDVMRSFSHEMIHHLQNMEGRLNHQRTTNTTEDDNLMKLEEEAYLQGNITFRNWEDTLKN